MSEKYDVAVIGSGSGGSEAAFLAAKKGFKVILIEKDAIGGTRFSPRMFCCSGFTRVGSNLSTNCEKQKIRHSGGGFAKFFSGLDEVAACG
jgi:flavin-dependent dehydrogenase